MASYTKREGKRGVRWTVRIRLQGRAVTKTFPSKAAGEAWARRQEGAIETGEFRRPQADGGAILADAIDAFTKHRTSIKRPPGKTFTNALKRLKDAHGLESLATLTPEYWISYATKRVAAGADGSTVASELAYLTSVLRHAKRDHPTADPTAPGLARTKLREDGVRVISRQRDRRISDDELAALFAWIDANADRTSLPLRDLVEFALATGMRRGEILALEWTDIKGRIALIKRKHPTERDRYEKVPLLKPHPQWPKADPLQIIERQPKQGRRVFPYVADTLGFWFEKAAEGANVDGVVFHGLRHECLSRLADRGFDPLRLAMVGGHRDLRNVKRYAKLDAEKLANE